MKKILKFNERFGSTYEPVKSLIQQPLRVS